VGIRPGDRIVSANDTVIAGKKLVNKDILKTLRGPKGSRVDLKVKRSGEPELLDFVVIRDDIPIYSVDAAYMADATTGYIRISRFAEDTHTELVQALTKLRKQGMVNLIIDLSDNGGGFLGSAFKLASEFLPKGAPIVSTKGLSIPGSEYVNESDGSMMDGRLVVIVNQYSASASEILSGAIQDNDRGLIVGRRTFGKGLVQRPFPFPDGSMIRLTTARYYTPSGRCIQKHYDKGQGEEYQLDLYNRYNSGELWSADSIHIADSTKYETLRNHRTVYGGGGIIPDLFVPVDTSYYSPYYRDLVGKGVSISSASLMSMHIAMSCSPSTRTKTHLIMSSR
jgi:carboxyl-terminal processing protease